MALLTSLLPSTGKYGTHLNVYSWSERRLLQQIDLGPEGVMPLEIRFLHDPNATEGFVGCALYANVFRYEDCDISTVFNHVKKEVTHMIQLLKLSALQKVY